MSFRQGIGVVIEEGCKIGNNTFIGNYTVLRPNTKIGDNCKIGHLVICEGNTVIGNNVVIQSQCHLTRGLIIEDDAFIAPGVVTCNDRKICHRRRHLIEYDEKAPKICRAARIGSGAILLPGVIIGENAFVGAGSVVTKHVPSREFWFGNPAKKVKTISEKEII
jgi:acetyltransferase-like isoleucine patch superfamily enzyme